MILINELSSSRIRLGTQKRCKRRHQTSTDREKSEISTDLVAFSANQKMEVAFGDNFLVCKQCLSLVPLSSACVDRGASSGVSPNALDMK